MDINLSETDININYNYAVESEIEDIRRCLTTLYSTPVGSVALDRDFGLDPTLLDYPTETAKSLLAVEIMKKTAQYEKRVEVKEVTFTINIEGLFKPKVVVDYVGIR